MFDKMKRSPYYAKSTMSDGYIFGNNETTYVKNVKVKGNNERKVAEIAEELTY